MPTFSIRTALSLALVLGTSQAQAQTGATAAYAHFEARQTHPIGLTPDGTRLLALNSPEGRLSVFDVSNPANPTPVLLAEIPVGCRYMCFCLAPSMKRAGWLGACRFRLGRGRWGFQVGRGWGSQWFQSNASSPLNCFL